MTDMTNLPVRKRSIYCKDHPEWGTFGVMEDHGGYYEIHGRAGSRVLDKWEAVNFWAVSPRDLQGMTDDEFQSIVLHARQIQGRIVSSGGMATKTLVENELMADHNLNRAGAHDVMNFIQSQDLAPVYPEPTPEPPAVFDGEGLQYIMIDVIGQAGGDAGTQTALF